MGLELAQGHPDNTEPKATHCQQGLSSASFLSHGNQDGKSDFTVRRERGVERGETEPAMV